MAGGREMDGSMKRRMAVAALVAVTVLALAPGRVGLAAGGPTSPPPDLEAWITRALDTFHTPGAAVAVVKDGRVVFSRGFGRRRLGAPETVDEDTLFGIASNTKAFTATALALLVDEGRIGWDDRVIDRLPGFRMSDPFVTRESTIRDLLPHRSGMGLGAGDLMFFPDSDLTRDQIVFKQRFLPLAASFRSA